MSINKVIVNDETKLDLSKDTATAENVEKGFTFHDANGDLITGTLQKASSPADVLENGKVYYQSHSTEWLNTDDGIVYKNNGQSTWEYSSNLNSFLDNQGGSTGFYYKRQGNWSYSTSVEELLDPELNAVFYCQNGQYQSAATGNNTVIYEDDGAWEATFDGVLYKTDNDTKWTYAQNFTGLEGKVLDKNNVYYYSDNQWNNKQNGGLYYSPKNKAWKYSNDNIITATLVAEERFPNKDHILYPDSTTKTYVFTAGSANYLCDALTSLNKNTHPVFYYDDVTSRYTSKNDSLEDIVLGTAEDNAFKVFPTVNGDYPYWDEAWRKNSQSDQATVASLLNYVWDYGSSSSSEPYTVFFLNPGSTEWNYGASSTDGVGRFLDYYMGDLDTILYYTNNEWTKTTDRLEVVSHKFAGNESILLCEDEEVGYEEIRADDYYKVLKFLTTQDILTNINTILTNLKTNNPAEFNTLLTTIKTVAGE